MIYQISARCESCKLCNKEKSERFCWFDLSWGDKRAWTQHAWLSSPFLSWQVDLKHKMPFLAWPLSTPVMTFIPKNYVKIRWLFWLSSIFSSWKIALTSQGWHPCLPSISKLVDLTHITIKSKLLKESLHSLLLWRGKILRTCFLEAKVIQGELKSRQIW